MYYSSKSKTPYAFFLWSALLVPLNMAKPLPRFPVQVNEVMTCNGERGTYSRHRGLQGGTLLHRHWSWSFWSCMSGACCSHAMQWLHEASSLRARVSLSRTRWSRTYDLAFEKTYRDLGDTSRLMGPSQPSSTTCPRWTLCTSEMWREQLVI